MLLSLLQALPGIRFHTAYRQKLVDGADRKFYELRQIAICTVAHI